MDFYCGLLSSPAILISRFVITHASNVCGQNSFELPLKMNGMNRTRFRLLPLVI